MAAEEARTALEVAFPDLSLPVTVAEINTADTRMIAELQQMTNVVILVSLVIAGCSLAGERDRGSQRPERPFSLLRLTGISTGVRARWWPSRRRYRCCAIAVISMAMGFVAAGLFLRSQLSESLRAPGLDYFVDRVLGLVASLRSSPPPFR